jgi:RNA polymerase sigma factor (sigma-70 family)
MTVRKKNLDTRSQQELPLPDEMLWQNALSFVSDRKRKNIIGKVARKFMVFSPYGVEDYFSEAAAVAFEAMKLSLANNDVLRQEGYFWTMLKSAFYKMSTNPAQQDVITGEGAGSMACVFDEYIEEWSEDNDKPPTGVSSNVTPLEKAVNRETLDDVLFRKGVNAAFQIMTDREREVWEMIFNGRSVQEIAQRLGTSRQNVEKLRERGIAKIQNGCLP